MAQVSVNRHGSVLVSPNGGALSLQPPREAAPQLLPPPPPRSAAADAAESEAESVALKRQITALLSASKPSPLSAPRRAKASERSSSPRIRNAMYAPPSREAAARRDTIFSSFSRSPRFGSPRTKARSTAGASSLQRRTTKFRGVVWDGGRNSWRAEVGVRDDVTGVVQRRVIGYYATDSDAARAYDQVVSQMRDTRLMDSVNFPSSTMPSDREISQLQRRVGELTAAQKSSSSSALAVSPRSLPSNTVRGPLDGSLTLVERDQRLRQMAAQTTQSSPAAKSSRRTLGGEGGRRPPPQALVNSAGSTAYNRSFGVKGKTNLVQPGGGSGGKTPEFDVLGARAGSARPGARAGGELSTTAKLRAIFKRYARYGSSVASASRMGLQGWMKFVQDADVIFREDVEAAAATAAKIFVQATSSPASGAVTGAAAPLAFSSFPGAAAALAFSSFLGALTLLANAAEAPPSTPAAALGPHRALERLLSGYVLLNLWPLGEQSGGGGGSGTRALGPDAARSSAGPALMSDGAAAFFAEHRSSLHEIFTRYASAPREQRAGAGGPGPWARTRQHDRRMHLNSIIRWAADAGVIPDMVNRVALRNLFDDAASADALYANAVDGGQSICYDQWLEFLRALAKSVSAGAGEDTTVNDSHMLGMLFVRMRRQANVSFVTPNEKRIVKVSVVVCVVAAAPVAHWRSSCCPRCHGVLPFPPLTRPFRSPPYFPRVIAARRTIDPRRAGAADARVARPLRRRRSG